MIDRYRERKEKGLAKVVSTAKGPGLYFKRFNPFTGEKEPVPQVVVLDSGKLHEVRDALQAQLDDVDLVFTDIAGLKQRGRRGG